LFTIIKRIAADFCGLKRLLKILKTLGWSRVFGREWLILILFHSVVAIYVCSISFPTAGVPPIILWRPHMSCFCTAPVFYSNCWGPFDNPVKNPHVLFLCHSCFLFQLLGSVG
jgi:hypothetical protein